MVNPESAAFTEHENRETNSDFQVSEGNIEVEKLRDKPEGDGSAQTGEFLEGGDGAVYPAALWKLLLKLFKSGTNWYVRASATSAEVCYWTEEWYRKK